METDLHEKNLERIGAFFIQLTLSLVMVKAVFIIFSLIGIAVNSYGQKKQPLTILKSTTDTLDIRYNNNLDSQSWILSSKKKIDVLPIQIDDNPIKVTFISSIDSISFHVNVGDKYDFIIVNGKEKYHTRIEGIRAYHTRRDDSLAYINYQCLKTDLLSVAERNRKYPFNKATRIELISFTDTGDVFPIPLPVKNGRLDHSKIVDRKILHTEKSINLPISYLMLEEHQCQISNIRSMSDRAVTNLETELFLLTPKNMCLLTSRSVLSVNSTDLVQDA